ncbi:unnamed protein product [Ilex paraguariensis]|uniref:Aminotransferase-like plant mobile domain-containing protein n=1 Tax=Ilex paraguariensis TaxID=185542 RepID=A0ABC8SWQ1_9AQUA
MADPGEDTIFEEREENMVSPTGGKPTLRIARFSNPQRYPQKGWQTWVDQLKPLYQQTWKKAGIYEAILASTYQTLRHNDLVIALAERWCIETNTFIFPWGEATVSLEDMVVLGGYSVLGDPVFSPLYYIRLDPSSSKSDQSS